MDLDVIVDDYVSVYVNERCPQRMIVKRFGPYASGAFLPPPRAKSSFAMRSASAGATSANA